MTVELSHEELVLLVRVLERELASVGSEIRHTRTAAYREKMKADRAGMKSVLDRLRRVSPV